MQNKKTVKLLGEKCILKVTPSTMTENPSRVREDDVPTSTKHTLWRNHFRGIGKQRLWGSWLNNWSICCLNLIKVGHLKKRKDFSSVKSKICFLPLTLLNMDSWRVYARLWHLQDIEKDRTGHILITLASTLYIGVNWIIFGPGENHNFTNCSFYSFLW